MTNKPKTFLGIFFSGLFNENPLIRLMLGVCPALAITTAALNGWGMGIITTAVLIASNLFVSLLRHGIPEKAKAPVYLLIIAGFVTVAKMLVQAFWPGMEAALGIFLPLIAINCMLLGRAQHFASKNGPVASVVDGLGMGLGFTLVLVLVGSIREIMGSGTWFGMAIGGSLPVMSIFTMAPGGFFVFGLVVALGRKLGQNHKLPKTSKGGA